MNISIFNDLMICSLFLESLFGFDLPLSTLVETSPSHLLHMRTEVDTECTSRDVGAKRLWHRLGMLDRSDCIAQIYRKQL